jgi:hypothetical protein
MNRGTDDAKILNAVASTQKEVAQRKTPSPKKHRFEDLRKYQNHCKRNRTTEKSPINPNPNGKNTGDWKLI